MSSDPTDRCHDLQPQLAAYALGESEADPDLLTHLASCEACQRALQGYTHIARILPYTAPQATPPPELRARILDAATSAPVESRAAQRRPAPAAHPWWRVRLAPRWSFAAVMLLALLGWNIALQMRLNSQAAQIERLSTQVANSRQSWQTMTRVLNTPDLQDYELSGESASGRFWASPQLSVACLVAQGLPDPGSGKVYQVWLNQGGTPIGVGTFVPQSGNGWVLLPVDQPLATYQGVGVTIEPRGGSQQPTSPAVLRGALVVSAQAQRLSRTERIYLTDYLEMTD
ncbi:MAG TPA: anti-sigma factor [Herpetosiphonaceae bacterium]